MIRTLTGIGFALALVGSAHAQEQQVTVKLSSKSPGVVRAEIYRAAVKVCSTDVDLFNSFDETCIAATYAQAIRKVRAMPRIEQTAYQASPSVH